MSPHSNVKPVVEAPVAEEKKIEPIVYEMRKPPEPTPRPTGDEALVELQRSVAPSLITALENLTLKTKPLGKLPPNRFLNYLKYFQSLFEFY